jgi:hypothetical protein
VTLHRTAPDACPYCGHRVDAATTTPGARGTGPCPNDASICIACGSMLIYDDDLRLRRPDPGELAELEADPRVQLTQLAWREAFGSRPA